MSEYENELHKIENIIEKHTAYMRNSINLIASENILILSTDMLKDNLMKDYMKDVNMLMK